MKAFAIAEILTATGGRLVQGETHLKVTRVHTDSRSIQPGDLFVAIVGEHFDGHEFVADVAKKGAVAALVSGPVTEELPAGFVLIQVPETLAAIQALAGWYRRTLNVKVVGVTGSSGKTSTKEMIAAVLKRSGKVLSTVGNLNNHLGVPLTLLQMDETHDYAVVEMGMNHRGEIAPLAKMAAPDIGVITVIGRAHIEFFKNVEEIALEKSDLLTALPASGVAVLNGDDPYFFFLSGRAKAKVISAGIGGNASWRGENLRVTEHGVRFDLVNKNDRREVLLPVMSRRLVNNALLAAAVGGECGLDLDAVAKGLADVELPGQRLKVLRVHEWTILNDAYNANPDSMTVALEAVRDLPFPGPRIAVLGSMGELGVGSSGYHEEVGEYAARLGMKLLVCVGPDAEFIRSGACRAGMPPAMVHVVTDAKGALSALRAHAPLEAVILVKGSRFMKLETIVNTLTGETSGGAH